MVESEQESGAIAFKVFINGNGRKNAQAVIDWVKAQELKRSQLISITSKETQVEAGQNQLTLVYRTSPSEDPADVPLDNMSFKIFDITQSWPQLYLDFEQFSKGKDICGLTHSAKNVGESHSQLTFYLEGSAAKGACSLQIFEDNNVAWDDMLSTCVGWLNKHVAPHQLVSVSCFEQDHPNSSGKMNIVVTHTAGKDPKPLAQEHLPAEGLYSFKTVEAETMDQFDGAVEELARWQAERGNDAGLKVSSCNDSRNDTHVVVGFSWYGLQADTLTEKMRPADGCCTIF